MKFHSTIAAIALAVPLALSSTLTQAATSVLFIGNSFTFGYGSAMRFYRADTIRDLNHEGQGGVPALFKSFTQQVGLEYDVAIETRGGTGIDWHLANKLSVINQQPWDIGWRTASARWMPKNLAMPPSWSRPPCSSPPPCRAATPGPTCG